MRSLLCLFLLVCCKSLFGQQIEISGGFHSVGSQHSFKPVAGFSIKHIYNSSWGVYSLWYFKQNKPADYSSVIHTASPGQAIDSTVAITPLMPHGFTVGACYAFSFGLSVYTGVGLSVNREVRSVFTNYYDGNGYLNLDHQTSSETYRVTSKKFCVDLQADFDILPRSAWSFGPRLGYNTVNGISGQIFWGYNFGS